MKQTNWLVSFGVIALLMASCSKAPSLDTSSDEQLQSSVNEIVESLPDDKKEAFQDAIVAIYMTAAITYKGSGKSGDEVRSLVNAKLDGMNADEVFELSESIRLQVKENQHKISQRAAEKNTMQSLPSTHSNAAENTDKALKK